MATYTDNYNLIKPSYSEIADVATINTNMNTIDDIMHSTQVSLAPAYDSTQTYNTGDVVMYELLMYKCKENCVTGTWNASKWERTTASECGDSGSDVEANPTGTATEELNKLRVDNTIYSIPEGSEVVVYGEASGDLITIEDAMEAPLEDCKVTLEPQQDLHGYDSPWPAGGGKNVLNLADAVVGNDWIIIDITDLILLEQAFYASAFITNLVGNMQIQVEYTKEGTTQRIFGNLLSNAPGKLEVSGTIQSFDANTNVRLVLKNQTSASVSDYFMTYSSDHSYAPYSNICPISGWDECNVTVADDVDNPTTSNVYTIQLGSTCYGGELDVKSGVLKVTDGYIASYNGETLPSTWISDRDVYAPNTSPTTGAEVVYKLATPQEIQLTPTEVTLLRGINNIWSDGEMYVKYRRDLDTTINQLAQHLTYGYGGTPSFNGNDGDVHIVLNSLNKKKGEFMWLNNQWTLIEGSGEVALKVYDNGVEGVAWSVTGGTKNATNISLTVGTGTFTNYAITNSAVNVTNYSTLTVVCKYRDQNYTKVIDLTNVSGNKYISFLYVTDSNHNECAVGLTDTNSPSPTYRVDSRNGGTSECIMYSCTLE